MKRISFLFVICMAFAFSACSSNGDNSPLLGGTYTGSYTSTNGYQGTISLMLPGNVINESGFAWSASGTVDVDGSDSPVSLNGTGEYVYPDIAFTVEGAGAFPDRRLTGTVGSNGNAISASGGVESLSVNK